MRQLSRRAGMDDSSGSNSYVFLVVLPNSKYFAECPGNFSLGTGTSEIALNKSNLTSTTSSE